MFNVMMECRMGAWRPNMDRHGLYWEDKYHTITWRSEPDRATAEAVVADIQAGKSRDVRRVWIDKEEQ